nr:hypothetical protein [Tanacetum cinerariifolium]
MVRQVLRLDDAESIDCLPNEEIFAAWNEFSSSMVSVVICLETDAQVGDLSSHTTKYTSHALIQKKVFANIRRVGKGFSRVDTLLFYGMLLPQQVNDDDVVDVVADADAEPTSPKPATTPPPPLQELIPSTSQVAPTPPPSPHQSPITLSSSPPQQQQPSHTTDISMDLFNTLLETCTNLTRRVKNLEQDKIAQAFEITKLKQRVRRLEKKKKLKVSGFKRLRKGRLKESQSQVYHIDLEHTDKVLSMHDDEAEPAKLKQVIEVVTTAKCQEKYDDIRPIFKKHFNSIVAFLEKGEKELEEEANKAIKRKSKTSEEKAAKKQKLDEEVKEHKTHLQ